VRKVAKLDHAEVSSPSEEPEGRKIKEEMSYSLTGITLGLVMRQTGVVITKTCGLFALYLPEWILVETFFTWNSTGCA
jgi:hypothetical protein